MTIKQKTPDLYIAECWGSNADWVSHFMLWMSLTF